MIVLSLSDRSFVEGTRASTCGQEDFHQALLSTFVYKNLMYVRAFQVVLVVKTLTCRCRRCKRCGFNPWVWKIRWRRAWQPTLVFLPGECHG